MLKLSDWTYINNKWPELRLNVDGLPVVLSNQCSIEFLKMGYVFLGLHFVHVAPVLIVTTEQFLEFTGKAQKRQVLRGWTDDPGVVHAQRQLFYDVMFNNFQPGSVPFRAIPPRVLEAMTSRHPNGIS